MTDTTNIRVLIVNIKNPARSDDQILWEDMYLNFQNELTGKYATELVNDAAAAIAALGRKENPPHVALVVSSELFQQNHESYADLHRQLARFSRDAGGVVIFCAMVMSLARWDKIHPVFNTYYNLPWSMSAYTKVDQVPNESMKAIIGETAFATLPEYYPKAVFLSGVEKDGMLYVNKKYDYNDDEPDSEEEHGKDEEEEDEGENCQIAFQSYGQGRIGWVGDVNNHEGPPVAAIHAMIGSASR